MHNVEYGEYEENVNKKRVQEYWDNYAAREDWEEGCSGLNGNIRWINYICESRDEAYEYIEAHDNGWYDQVAVKFKEYPEFKHTKKYDTLVDKLGEVQKKFNALESKVHYAGVVSKFIGCKKCGSKIASAYIKSNYCPVCGEDLRPATVLKTVNNYKEKISQLQKEIKEEGKKIQKKMEKQATIKWLTKIEYHT